MALPLIGRSNWCPYQGEGLFRDRRDRWAIMFVVPRVLIGKRVLIVEDEGPVALVIEGYLSDFGCISVGPCSTVVSALNAGQE